MKITLIANVGYSRRGLPQSCGYKFDPDKQVWYKPIDAEFLTDCIRQAYRAGFDFWVPDFETVPERNILLIGHIIEFRKETMKTDGFTYNQTSYRWEKKILHVPELMLVADTLARDSNYILTPKPLPVKKSVS